MKAITKWSENLRRYNDSATPFMEIDVEDEPGREDSLLINGPDRPASTNIRLYWTKGGINGPQCLTIIRKTSRDTGMADAFTETTSGCGYSKADSALGDAFYFLGHPGIRSQDDIRPYKVGGNYYYIPREALRQNRISKRKEL